MSQSTVPKALDEAGRKMKSALSVLREELGAIRTGRATPALLSRVTFDYYGTQQPIKDMASMSVPEPRLLVIQPFDKSAIDTARALADRRTSGSGEPGVVVVLRRAAGNDATATIASAGNVIRLAFPPLTEERRKDLIKMVHQRAEEARVAVRNVRRHSKEEIERLEHGHAISEDELRRAEKELQRLTDQFVAEVDDATAHKEKELLEV